MNLWVTLSLLAAASLNCGASVFADVRYNIVFILADDLTYTDAGCYGNPDVKTPNIDRLAAEGMKFNHSYTAVSMCSPTRQFILTGMYPVKSGAYPQRSRIRDGVKTLPVYMKELGYRVAMAGKQHYSPLASYPFEVLSPAPLDFSKFEEFMTRDKDEPFCLYVCSTQPHTPWDQGDPTAYDADKLTLPPYLADTPKTRDLLTKYYGEVTYLDSQVGKVLDLLESTGNADNTLVMFSSEQGAAMPFAKWTLYDAGMRNQLIVRWPGIIQPGTETNAMVQYCDLVPTWIEVAGGKPTDELDGRSFLRVLSGMDTTARDVVFGVHTSVGIRNGKPYPIRGIRDSRYKLLWNLTPEEEFSNNLTVLDRKWFFFNSWRAIQSEDQQADFLVKRYIKRPQYELYDTEADPYELRNLADSTEHQEIRKKLLAQLTQWMDDQGDRGVETEHEAPQHFRLGEPLDKNDKKKKKKKKK